MERIDNSMSTSSILNTYGHRIATNYILTGPTQMAKTKYISDTCKNYENKGYLIVISYDSRITQSVQLTNRFNDEGIINYTLKTAIVEQIGAKLNSGKSVVIVLNNAN
jgi:hypothetical protein